MGEKLKCIDDYGHDTCSPYVWYGSNPYSDSLKSWPRCDKHYEDYVDRMQEIAQRYPVNAPSDFDPAYAGERWDADY